MKNMNRPIPITRDAAPCKGCADRYPACHGECENYKSWRERLDEVNQRRKEYNNKPFVQYNPFDY